MNQDSKRDDDTTKSEENEDSQVIERKESEASSVFAIDVDPRPPLADSDDGQPGALHDSGTKDRIKTPRRGRSVESRHSHVSVQSRRTGSDGSSVHDHQVPPLRQRSRPQSSIRSVIREAEKVPRSQRRGLLSRLTLIAEVTDPYAYSRGKKWTLTFVVAVAAAAAPMGSAIILPALHDVARDYNTSLTVVNLSVSVWMLAMSIFPLWWSSFSESLGRRTIYIASFTLYLVFGILAAISQNIAMFLVMRTFSGGAAASVQAVGAGSIADFWEVRERGTAMGIFYLGPLCGPLIAPIIGGIMAERLGWRSTEWFLAIFGGVVLVLIIFCLPETLRQRNNVVALAEQEAVADVEAAIAEKSNTEMTVVRPTLTRATTKQSVQVRTVKYLVILRRCLLDPLRIILYIQVPAVAILVAYGSIAFTSLYILNISVQQTFSASPYNYSSIIVGLLYIPNSTGYVISSIFGGKWVDRIMHREARNAGRYDEKGKLIFRPEDRLKENAWFGAILFPAALIIYGWTADYGVNIAAPMVANFFFGLGSMMIFAVATTMLTEFMPGKASNGVALNNFLRNILGCIGTVVTEPLIVAIGNGWLFTIIGLFSLVVGAFTIWAMKKFGDRWRAGMDAKMAKIMGER